MNTVLSRRTVLRGVGTAVALPLLDAMLPGAAGAGAKAAAPRRMAFIYTPNGAYMPFWMPTSEGVDYKLPVCLEPLAGLQSDDSPAGFLERFGVGEIRAGLKAGHVAFGFSRSVLPKCERGKLLGRKPKGHAFVAGSVAEQS